jgi:SpoVK/Ycf46/Vps4 family AAA+-type ATPase
VKSSNDRFANLEVNYWLQRLDSFLGIAVLTTNLGTAIDSAFKRRLTFRLQFPVPDEEQREQLWRVHLPSTVPVGKDLDLEELARKYPLTGGSVRNCALRAAFLAASESVPLGQDHLLRAIRLEYRAAGKLSESGTLE